MLRSEIIGEAAGSPAAKGLRFIPLPEGRWPRLIHEQVRSDEDVEARAQQQLGDWVQQTDQTYPLRIMVIQGPTQACIIGATPHQFTDGVGIASFLAKIVAYERVPRFFWPILGLMSSRHVPLHRDLLGAAHRTPISELSPSVRLDEANIKLSLPSSPTDRDLARAKLNWQLPVSVEALASLRESVRREGTTISALFSALAAKLTALLTEAGGGEVKGSQILVSLPVEARALAPKHLRPRPWQFPVVANYASPLYCQIPLAVARSQPVVKLAHLVKASLARGYNRPYLSRELTCMAENALTPRDHLHQYIGASSMNIGWWQVRFLGATNITADGAIQFGGFPHVWFYIVTTGNKTMVTIDVDLPLSGLTPDRIRNLMFDAAKGSPLALLLESATASVISP